MTLNPGRRNLMILGIATILIAALTTSLELWLYRSSGDIYLDRSRPGFLPDREEFAEEGNGNSSYVFPDNGSLDAAEIEDYLDALETVINNLNELQSPYSELPLSDESLGIVPSSTPDNETSTPETIKR